MAELYATLITNGIRTFESIPGIQKEAVKKILINGGNEHFVVE